MFVTKRLRSALSALMLCLPLLAQAEEWPNKKMLTFDTTATGAEIKESANQFPLLVRLHSGNFAFAEANIDGSDLRFFAADGKTPLKFHIEKFDGVNEMAAVWVQMPKLLANAKTDAVWMRWGNPEAAAGGDANGTYDASQLLVFHFSDEQGVKDATANANHAVESTAQPVAAGPIGSAAAFDGNARVALPASASLKLGAATGFTFSAWVKPAGADDGALYVQREGTRALSIGLSQGTLVASLDAATAKASVPLKPAVWQHVAVLAGAGKLSFYVDGVEAGNAPFAMADIAGEAVIGEGLRGELDEVTLAGTARSGEYVKALALSQIADSAMSNFDAGEEAEGEISHAKILLESLTLDGWIVVIILLFMAIISFWVMIAKAMSQSSVKKANAAFLEIFAQKSTQLLTPGHAEIAALAADAKMKPSTIYHLYLVGLREMKRRFDEQTAAGKDNSLSATALEAIRASLDATNVRENQRLNSGMVLLTIAISGGPFLGLLGTVAGVMITFAAIAAAGDVNVNAIAPGVAGALVATVAGLLVAIPALFGYNWLATGIKGISADTQVFADEFLTKSAEMHSA